MSLKLKRSQSHTDTEYKSWSKINQNRKALKKKFKQEKLLKELEKMEKLNELSNGSSVSSKSVVEQATNCQCMSTISIAVPGSILENAQSPELRSYLAGQIARAACIFRVDEIIVFNDFTKTSRKRVPFEISNSTDFSDPDLNNCLHLARILQYLECPQYLRKFFFPLHNDLKYCGLLNPLDAPHHLRQQNTFMYREGVVTEKTNKEGKSGSYVNVGLFNDILIDKSLLPGIRVTVRIDDYGKKQGNGKKIKGVVVSPKEPRIKTGVYWGYTVRIANSLSNVFTKCPYKDGYDLTIGTSDKGTNINEIHNQSLNYKHALLVFGGLQGLEIALKNDQNLNFDDPQLLFDNYINVVPSQGSRTIRTEEAILITLSILNEKLNPKYQDIKFDLKNLIPQSEDTGKKQYHQIDAKNVLSNTDLSRF